MQGQPLMATEVTKKQQQALYVERREDNCFVLLTGWEQLFFFCRLCNSVSLCNSPEQSTLWHVCEC